VNREGGFLLIREYKLHEPTLEDERSYLFESLGWYAMRTFTGR